MIHSHVFILFGDILTLSMVIGISAKIQVLMIIEKELIIMVKKQEKCQFCGGRHYILSTEREGKNWICERVCKKCGKIVEENIVKG
ncbi:MAG: hypothetical protein ISS48_03140 [Candidatus Aenigmarchaeota archaeon]|nr:hypothetical protein [Candidatus Aenigmarchaeota archaeon]